MVRLTITAVLSALLIFGVGCGKDESTTAPAGSTITINPSGIDIADGSSGSSVNTQYFTVSVFDDEGNAMENAELNISFPWAVPNSFGAVQLYDGATPVDSPFVATTDETGVYQLRFDYLSGGGYSYTGDLEVRSGSAFATATVTVTAD